MKLLVVFCLSAISSVCGLKELHRLAGPIVDSLAPNLYYIKTSVRQKRSTVTIPLDDPDNCISQCATQLNTRLTELQLDATFYNTTDAIKLQFLCQAFAPAAPCFHSCNVSQLERLVEDFLPVMSLICNLGDQNYPELLESLTCINSTKRQIDEKCSINCDTRNLVGDLDTALGAVSDKKGNNERRHSTVHVNLLPNFVVYDDNKTLNTENFDAACKFLSCVDDCDDAIIKETCGPQASRVQNKVLSTIVRAMKALFRDLDAVYKEPEECKRYDFAV